MLARKKLVLALAESCTGGGLAYQFTSVPDSSSWFDRCFVTYSNASKVEMLGVNPKTLEKYGAVSSQIAEEMAKGAIKHSHSDISLSITGIACPDGGSVEKPVGMVFFGLADRHGLCQSRLAHFTSGRKQIRDDSITFGLQWLLEYVTGERK